MVRVWLLSEVARRRAEKRVEEADGEQQDEGTGRRRSERPRKSVVYQEAREWTRRVDSGRRKAVAAQHGARVGVRLWWWMEGGEGWDASGPGSVRKGVYEVRDDG